MLKNRYFISYLSTTILYVTVIGLFLYIQKQTKVATQSSQEKVMKVRLSDFVPEQNSMEEIPVEKEVEEVVEPEEIKEKVIKKDIEKIIPETSIKPLPSLFKPVVKKSIKKVPEIKKFIKVVKKKQPVKQKPIKKISRTSSKKTKANPEKVNKFYKKIRVKINQNKSYPKIAKRRGMQGSVKVTFTVLRSGKISNVHIKGPKIFHNSARHAVQSAFPISVKNIPVSLPTTINVKLQYQIR